MLAKAEAKVDAAKESIKASAQELVERVGDQLDAAKATAAEVKAGLANKVDDKLDQVLSWSEGKITEKVEGAVGKVA
eukprot:SAG31_NODE_31436_length_368_cov_0.821561_2_plen_76_part_01